MKAVVVVPEEFHMRVRHPSEFAQSSMKMRFAMSLTIKSTPSIKPSPTGEKGGIGKM